MNWHNTSQTASHWHSDVDRVTCSLCPRHCRPRDGQTGFCKVRGPINGTMKTFNYGRSVAATEEVIETEAVNHFQPGARILSLGNVGCMMSCTFCQNWETSQIKHLDLSVVKNYKPEDVINLCLTHNIDIISWTYNDPVVWHEFVIDTSRLANRHGIRTLYKSAFYIEERPVEELIACIDIFSISLKSMNDDFYRKVTKGRLQPVLDRIEQVFHSGKHLELSQLVIPELNDNNEDFESTVRWITEKLGIHIPLHFVAFHPAYKYNHVGRTPIKTLERAHDLAIKSGIEHCYLGNVYKPNLNNTYCKKCNATLVTRYGLTAKVNNLTKDSHCTQCGHLSPIIEPYGTTNMETIDNTHKTQIQLTHFWQNDVKSAHINQTNNNEHALTTITVTPINGGRPLTRTLGNGLDRIIISKQNEADHGFTVAWDGNATFEILPVLDRAHFPVKSSTNGALINIATKNMSMPQVEALNEVH